MPTSLLSSLSRGYGTWTGSFDTSLPNDNSLPSLDPGAYTHRHGVTVTPRASTAPGVVPISDDGHLDLPKTFVTRKGALMLFSAPDSMPEEPAKTPRPKQKRHRQKDIIDLSLKLGTLERLSLSVLQYGDKAYDKEAASVSDKENHLYLNFPHDMNEVNDESDLRSQPGGDFRFYLQDLKRRASCRSYGNGDSSSFRARSTELQEILDELEHTWSHYNASQSQRGESMFTGSKASGVDFFHRASPTPSVKSVRSLSRSKILSSKKLTASLKSLDYLGRSVSAEPDIASVQNESVPPASSEYWFGRSRSAKSSVWVADAACPPESPYIRPACSAKGVTSKPPVDRRLLTSPEHTEEYGAGEGDARPLWVEVDAQGDTSFVSDDLQSQLSGMESDLRTADRGQTHTPVRGEGPYTPSKGDKSGERDAMLTEAASVLSSLIEEEDIDVPLDDLSDEGEEPQEADQWPAGEQQRRKSAASARSKVSQKPASESRQSTIVDEGLAKPLQAPYADVTKDTQTSTDDKEGDDVITQQLQQDSVPGSRSASHAGVQDGSRPVSAMADQLPSRAGSATPGIPSRVETPTGFAGHSEQTIEQVTEMISDGEKMRASSALGAASSSSIDKPTPDPDTLVSLQKNKPDAAKIETEDANGAAKLLRAETPEKIVMPSPESEVKAQPATQAKQTPDAAVTKLQELAKSTDSLEVKIEETVEEEPATPKRRKRPEDDERHDAVEDEKDEDENGENPPEDGPPKLSERVIREKEERAKKAAKLKEEKEEKERQEAKKREEEERKIQEEDDKRKAAEERIRQKAEEAARKKEEARLKKEEEAALGIQEPALQPTPPAGKKSPGTKGKTAGKGGKAGKKGAKETTADSTDGKQFVKALDITSVQPDDAVKEHKDLAAVNKLKEQNDKIEVPVDKLKEFIASETPKQKIEPEKKESQIPEHLKEMLDRKTEVQAQEELDAEMKKMQSAVDSALGGSVLQTEEAEGLSAEDFALAQEALMERIKKAQEEIQDGGATPRPETKKSILVPAKPKGNKKGKSPVTKKKKNPEADKKKELAKEREALKEQQRQEKQRRLEEAKQLQEKITLKEESRKTKEAEKRRKAQELEERMESIRQEEEEIEQAEADARAQLAALRKIQREEREARRKADLEKKKQEAINKREKEKTMIEAARQKEQEMLDRIADAEMARRLREEEEAKREEQELAAQERFEAEMKAAQRAAEEEEERLRELERQAEEEAFQRLLDEKEVAEQKRWELEEQARKMKEEEERMRREMLEEEERLREEMRKKEGEEEARREQERERLRELQRLEEEAREKMREELEKRRAWALRRREQNLKTRANLDAMRQSQGITEPWTFSYFVRWPKESYSRPMGQEPKKQKGPPKPKPKPPASDPNANPSGNAPPAVDVSAVPK